MGTGQLNVEVGRWRRAHRLAFLPETLLTALAMVSVRSSGVEMLGALRGTGDERDLITAGDRDAVPADLIACLSWGLGERSLVEVLSAHRFRIRKRWLVVEGSMRPTAGGVLWHPSSQWRHWGAREQLLPSADLAEVAVESTGGINAVAFVFAGGAGRAVYRLDAGRRVPPWLPGPEEDESAAS